MAPFMKPPARSRERLAFQYGPGTVPSRTAVDAAIASDPQPSFATASFAAEPRDWGYAGLLGFTAVLLLRPQDTIPALEPLHVAELFALIGIAPMVLHRFAQRLPVFRVTPETIGLLCFGAVMLATLPFSIWPGGAWGVFADSYLKVLVVFVLMMNTLTTPKRLQTVTWLIVLCIGYVAARGVFDYARGANLVEDGRLAGAIGGIFGNPNDLALNMVTFMPIAAIVAMSKRYPPWRRMVAAVIVVLMAATIVFTKSRGGVVGLAVMLAAFAVLGHTVRRGYIAVGVVFLLLATPFMPQSFWDRMATIVDARQDKFHFTNSREERRIVMQEGFNTFMERPFTGVGAGQFHNYNPPGRKVRWREAHNALIQVAADTGLFGLFAFSFLILRGFIAALSTRRILRRPRRRRDPDPIAAVLNDEERAALFDHSVGTTVALIGWFVCAMFASVAYAWTFYYLLALITAARELVRHRLAAARALGLASKPLSVPPPRLGQPLSPRLV
jgi:O-antigen ligase